MSEPQHVLVTGANGFVGQALVERLEEIDGHHVRAAVRTGRAMNCADSVTIGDINRDTDWSRALYGIDTVVHCAARVHVMNAADSEQSRALFREVNVEGSRRLAEAAVQAGVRRLVFLSSIKVNGESTTGRPPFTADAPPAPEDAYGISKMEAERVLLEVARLHGLELTIVRPPLVYGPGVKANFARLADAVARGTWLPLGAVDNRRSLVYLGNLVDLLSRCVRDQRAAGQTFLVSDGEDLSTSALIRCMAQARGRAPNLIPVPPSWMMSVARLLGKQAVADRLLGSLQVDIGPTCSKLDWTPPFSVLEGLRATFAT